MRMAPVIKLSSKERNKLARIKMARSSSIGARERAAMIQLAGEGKRNQEIAQILNQDKMKVGRWRQRYAQFGLEGILKDKTGKGRIPPVAKAKRARIVKMTIEEKPPGATHWSRASMAKASGVSPSTVGRIWRAHGLKPHRVSTFKLSNDKKFVEILEDVVVPYLNPPENDIVF